MPVVLSDVLSRVRSRVDETSTSFWTDTELANWINDACRQVARRTEDLNVLSTSLAVVAGTAKYAMPTDVVRISRVEFVVNTGNIYPLDPKTFAAMDNIWGVNQTITSAYPLYYVLFGYPGGTTTALTIQLFPVPSQGGTLNVYYYRMPYRFLDPIANPGELAKNVEVPEGWDDLVVDFATAQAFLKDKDANMYQVLMQQFESHLQDLLDKPTWNEMVDSFNGGGSPLPPWLTDTDGWEW